MSDELYEALDGRHTGTRSVAQWLSADPADTDLSPAYEAFDTLTVSTLLTTPDGPELTTGLRKLLEARDCILRAQALNVVESAPSKPVQP